jgi:hypothetical protein
MWALFLSSYTPMFVLIGLRSIDRYDAVVAAAALLTVIGVCATLIFLYTARRKGSGRYQLLEVENRDSDVAAYAATYLLPFILVFGGAWQDLASLGAFIAFLGFIYVRSRLIYVNPILALMGYRLWRVIPTTAGAPVATTDSPWPRYLLTRTGRISKGQIILAYRVTDDLLMRDKNEGDGSNEQ